MLQFVICGDDERAVLEEVQDTDPFSPVATATVHERAFSAIKFVKKLYIIMRINQIGIT